MRMFIVFLLVSFTFGQTKIDLTRQARGVLPATLVPAPTSSTLGGVKSSTCAGTSVANGLDTTGAVTCTTLPVTEIEVTSDWTNSTTTASSITGMNWSIAPSTISTFECWWIIDTAATTTGLQVDFTGPASPTSVLISFEQSLSSTADTARTTKTITAFSTFTTGTTSPGTTKQMWYINGVIINGANAGTIQPQGKSNTTSAVNIRKGSVCRIH